MTAFLLLLLLLLLRRRHRCLLVVVLLRVTLSFPFLAFTPAPVFLHLAFFDHYLSTCYVFIPN